MTDADGVALDHAIAVTEHLCAIDPRELVKAILEQMEEKKSLSTDERDVAGTAVLYAYNAIVAGAALAATVA